MVKPPPGPYAAGVLVPQWLLIGISFLVIVARLNLRVRVQRIPLMVSDYLMCCAWLCAVATAAFDIVFARMGVFHPDLDYFMLAYDGPPEDIEFVFKVSGDPPPLPGKNDRIDDIFLPTVAVCQPVPVRPDLLLCQGCAAGALPAHVPRLHA